MELYLYKTRMETNDRTPFNQYTLVRHKPDSIPNDSYIEQLDRINFIYRSDNYIADIRKLMNDGFQGPILLLADDFSTLAVVDSFQDEDNSGKLATSSVKYDKNEFPNGLKDLTLLMDF